MPIALVTGPTAGIGRSFASALALEGHDLVLVARDAARLHELADELSRVHDVACEVLVADLSDSTQAMRVEERLRGEPFDVLVNNAGLGLRRPFEHNDIDDEQQGFDVMVRAVMRLTHAAIGPMTKSRSGEIVNVSSVAGFLPRGTYGAHKAWVTSFSAWANLHYGPLGVRVMALCPGFVRTEFHQRMQADMSGVPSFMWLDSDVLVRDALRDLRKGRAVSIPSKRYKLVVAGSRVIPRGLVERLGRRAR